MTQISAISTCGLTKHYKNLTAIDQLDLSIQRGTVFGFLGRNGAGKTTTIRMLLGLIQPSSGSAQILGFDVARERHLIAPKVGAIVETPAFYTYLTGEQNLRVLARASNFSITPKRLAELVDYVGLTGREKHQVKTYSLGMKQRLGLAATLLTDPEIIFLDEPTNGLDPAGTVEMRELIQQLGREGRTIFLSSHLLNEVEQVCSEVAIIQRGVIRLQGHVQDLLAQNSRFSLLATPFDRAMALLGDHPELNATSPDQRYILISATQNEVPAILRKLVFAHVEVFQVQPHRASLEDIFLELTSEPATAEKRQASSRAA